MTKINVACVIGTRPEVIKMAPVIWQLQKHPAFHVDIINTAQHRSLLDDMLSLFHLVPDIDLNIMTPNQTLAELTGNLFLKLEPIFHEKKYQFVIAQGDTTTTLVAAEIAFYHKIPFGHVEAGLRSNDFQNPFPEEMNRVFASKLATLHFAPTYVEENILAKEGIAKESIFVTGNTVIDSLYYMAEQPVALPFELPKNKRIVLVTLHRREAFGNKAKAIFAALLALVDKFPDIQIIYPVHPNPNIHDLAYSMLNQHPSITLLAPLRYDVMVTLLKHAYLVCSDSGGLQEEAPALGKPLLILRETTERPLVVELGLAILVGTCKEKIIETASRLLSNEADYQALQKNISPYGDGHAAEKIVAAIDSYFRN